MIRRVAVCVVEKCNRGRVSAFLAREFGDNTAPASVQVSHHDSDCVKFAKLKVFVGQQSHFFLGGFPNFIFYRIRTT